jgi:hypothetical protein
MRGSLREALLESLFRLGPRQRRALGGSQKRQGLSELIGTNRLLDTLRDCLGAYYKKNDGRDPIDDSLRVWWAVLILSSKVGSDAGAAGYCAPDAFCASFAQESLSVTVRLKAKRSDVLSLSRTK